MPNSGSGIGVRRSIAQRRRPRRRPRFRPLAIGASVLGAVVVAIGIAAHTAPTTLAVLMLLPLSAFEATVALPAAAVALTRSRIAAARLAELAPVEVTTVAVTVTTPAHTPRLRASDVRAGYPGGRAGQAVTVDLQPGARLAITGRSGAGKTALLMSLAGLLPPISGQVTVDGVSTGSLSESELRSAICYFAEDAHLFSTTVRDNLLVARGDCSDEELTRALTGVGLGDWLGSLPDGLSTVLDGGAAAVSAGQRRRLLLARVLLCPAPIVLLDEPTEHLDAADGQRILCALLDDRHGLLSPGRTAVIATHQLGNDIGCPRLSIGNDG